MQQRVVIPEAQHAPALPLQELRSRRIGIRRMLRTVEFDDQPLFDATEVCDVRRDRVLAAEFEPVELRTAQKPPQHALRVGHFLAQAA
jgi:hypothetical protein